MEGEEQVCGRCVEGAEVFSENYVRGYDYSTGCRFPPMTFVFGLLLLTIINKSAVPGLSLSIYTGLAIHSPRDTCDKV